MDEQKLYQDLYYIDPPDWGYPRMSEWLRRISGMHFRNSWEVFTELIDNSHTLEHINQRQEAIRDILSRWGDTFMKEYDALRNLNHKVKSNGAVKVWKEPIRGENSRKPLIYNHEFLFECIQEFQSICARILEWTEKVASDPLMKLRAYFWQFVGNSEIPQDWEEEKQLLDQSNPPFFSVMDYDSWTHQIDRIYPIWCISNQDRQRLEKMLAKGIQKWHTEIIIKIGDVECTIKLITPPSELTPVYRKEPANRRYIDFDLFTNIRHHIVSDAVNILGKLVFYTEGAKLFSQLKWVWLPVCFPEVKDEAIIDIRNFYPLYHGYPKKQYTMNSLRLDAENPIAVITGLNAAGKSTILETVECIAHMARAWLPIPASSCTIGNFDNVTHQEIIGSDMGEGLSTFKNQTREIVTTLREHQETEWLSMGLFDESLSGTDHVTGKAAICEVLKILAQVIKKPTILVTHCTPAVQEVELSPADYPGVQLLCFRKTPGGRVSHKMQPGIGKSEGEYILTEEWLSLENFKINKESKKKKE